MRVNRLAAAERHRDRADREVALRQISLDRRPPQRGQVDLPGAVRGHGAPGRELGRELKRVPLSLPGNRLGGGRDVAADGQIEVDHVEAQRRIADGATDYPDLLAAGKRPPGQSDRRGCRESLSDAHAASRGTLAEIPQVTS